MTPNISEKEEFSKEKCANYEIIETAFSQYLHYKCWLVSDAMKKPFNPKTGTSEWGGYDLLCNFNEIQTFLNENPEYRPCIIPQAAGLIALDLDKIKDVNDEFPQWLEPLVERLGSYSEISQSGKGLHIIFSGECPGARVVGTLHGSKIEFLVKHPLTLTGAIFKTPNAIQPTNNELEALYNEIFPPQTAPIDTVELRSPPMSDEAILQLCRKAKNHGKFEALFDKGDLTAYQGDDSSADCALACCLAFYTQDVEQIFRLVQQSVLYKHPGRREKWAREDYRNNTLLNGIKRCSSFYQPKKEMPHVSTAATGSWDQPLPLTAMEDLDLPFPLSSLPFELRQAVEETARFAHTDPALPIIPGLGQLCLQIGKKILIQEKVGLLHHPSLFLIGAASSGERKSGVDEGMVGVVKRLIEAETPEYEQRKMVMTTQNELIEEQVAFVKKQLRDGKISVEDAGRQATELRVKKELLPAEPINFCDDITPPRVFQKLYSHGGAYGIFSSDGRKIFNRLIGRGEREGSTGEDIYVSAVWGDTIHRSRVSGGKEGEGENLFIGKPALTVAAYIQLDLWHEFLRNKTMRDSGLISRICMVNPTSRMGFRLETEEDKPLDYSLLNPYANIIMAIKKWKVDNPLLIKLSPQAAKERRHYFNAIEKEIGPGGSLEDVKDIATRNTSITTRIAGAFHLFEAAASGMLKDPGVLTTAPLEITLDQWLRAQSCGEYFLAQAIDMQRIHGRSGQDHLLEKAAIWLKKEARKHEGGEPLFILGSTIANRVRGIDPDTVESEVLIPLENMGWIRRAHLARGNKFNYEVNLRIRHL